MRVPIRKPGKYTHLKPDPNLTEAKLDELKKKLANLKAAQPEAAMEVKRLAELGDLSENAAYQIAKGRLRSINQRIIDLENHINSARLITRPEGNQVVQLGSEVVIEIRGEQKTYLILGSSETNPAQNIISHNSPIGSALMGHRVGEVVVINLKNGKVDCKIIKIK